MLLALWLAAAPLSATTPWSYPRYLANGGCRQQRVGVDLHNGLTRDAGGDKGGVYAEIV